MRAPGSGPGPWRAPPRGRAGGGRLRRRAPGRTRAGTRGPGPGARPVRRGRRRPRARGSPGMTTRLPEHKADARVLVVEDEPRLRELLVRALGGWGLPVASARSGE